MFLKGKTALITGSTSGIGLTCAQSLAQQGADIILNGFGDADEIEQERAAIEAVSGGKAVYCDADLTNPAAIEDMFTMANADMGGVDILINNAGTQYVSQIEAFPPDKWDLIIALNLTAGFHTARLAVPGMKQKGWGRIIATASAHSKVASPGKCAYVAAKHGIDGFTKTLALEVAEHGITVNAVSPGYVWTPLVEQQIPDTMKARGLSRDAVINDVLLKAQPTKQFVTKEQVASLVLYLCGEDASAITGANLSMDGGWTAQ